MGGLFGVFCLYMCHLVVSPYGSVPSVVLHVSIEQGVLSLVIGTTWVRFWWCSKVYKICMGGICTCGLHPSLPRFSTMGKLCLVVVAVQGAPPLMRSRFSGNAAPLLYYSFSLSLVPLLFPLGMRTHFGPDLSQTQTVWSYLPHYTYMNLLSPDGACWSVIWEHPDTRDVPPTSEHYCSCT